MQTCNGCRFFGAPRVQPSAAAMRVGADGRGDCNRYPSPVRKAAEQWCGEWREGKPPVAAAAKPDPKEAA